jgi:hypothetical protein
MEDPLVVIKKREMEERKRILDNPLKVGLRESFIPTSNLAWCRFSEQVFGNGILYGTWRF